MPAGDDPFAEVLARSTVVTPEPSTVALLGAGLVLVSGLSAVRRRSRGGARRVRGRADPRWPDLCLLTVDAAAPGGVDP
jgi:hypothetical protein